MAPVTAKVVTMMDRAFFSGEGEGTGSEKGEHTTICLKRGEEGTGGTIKSKFFIHAKAHEIYFSIPNLKSFIPNSSSPPLHSRRDWFSPVWVLPSLTFELPLQGC